LLALIFCDPGSAQPLTSGINWTVKSRFRLFQNEDDFKYVAQFHRPGGVLAAETALAAATSGIGWVAQSKIVARSQLCIDVAKPCMRQYSGDHERTPESYLNPTNHKIEVEPSGPPPAGAMCTWRLVTDADDATAIVRRDRPCGKEVFGVPYGKTTQVQLFVATRPEDSQPTATTNVKVRDILIAGLGDSTAAGEGDPDGPISLDVKGFCFRRVGPREYFRPSRANYKGNRSCTVASDADALDWSRNGALWMDRACHRSLYSYQARLALELAIENPQIAVTYIPLGCSGATIDAGMLGRQEARERCAPGVSLQSCSRWVQGQMETLRQILDLAHQRDKNRNLDLVLLTVGANDINFSGLVANVMIDRGSILKRNSIIRSRVISTVDQARQKLNELPGKFVALRGKLKSLLGNKLERVIYVSYGHPALYNDGQPCPTTLQGFDVHPAFKIDGTLLKATSDFVTDDFFPRLKALATCDSGGGCNSVDQDRMTFVDEHQAEFRNHGFCAQANEDPAFDRACFMADGRSFETDLRRAHEQPLTCRQPANLFRAYASRQRWIRTANDSYFAAMTYPDGTPKIMQPADIHDPLWGVASAVYGGAMHPTAQGYAAMADAALPAARRLLGLPVPR
jgi:lysophospholipase L1-like esterase